MNPFLLASMEDVKIAEQSYSTFFSGISPIVLLIIFALILILFSAVLGDSGVDFAGIAGAIPIALVFIFLFYPNSYYTLSHTYISADKETTNSLKIEHQGDCVFTVLNEGETYSTLFLRKQEAVTRDSNEVPSLMSTVEKSSKVEIYLEVDGELAKEVKIQPKEKITIDAKVIGENSQDGSVSKLEFKDPIKCHSLLK